MMFTAGYGFRFSHVIVMQPINDHVQLVWPQALQVLRIIVMYCIKMSSVHMEFLK